MHPIVAHELARGRIADFHHEAELDRRLHAARGDEPGRPHMHVVSAVQMPDPTRLVRRLLARLRPAVAP
jgi:hypothetical protein